jgi:hypothetical protein
MFDPTSQTPISTIPVINWSDAMQQVGDDEEFLRELLNDLRTETDTQLGNIAAIIQVSIFIGRCSSNDSCRFGCRCGCDFG